MDSLAGENGQQGNHDRGHIPDLPGNVELKWYSRKDQRKEREAKSDLRKR